MNKKRTVKDNLQVNQSLFYLTGPLDKVIQDLSLILNTHNKHYHNIRMSFEKGYDDETCIYFTGERFETDKEYETRIKFENNVKNNTEKQEKSLYQKLKKKYG